MGFANFRENIHLLLKLKESIIPQADGNFIKNWEVEARKYQYTSEHILTQLKEIRYTEGFVSAITSQLYYLRECLSNYDFMPDSEKDKFKRLYVLAALGLIAKLKLILFFSTYINSNNVENYVNDFNLNDSCGSSNEPNKNCGNDEHAKGNNFYKNRKCTSSICANNSGHNLDNNDSTKNNMNNRVQEKIKMHHDYNQYNDQNYDNSINEVNNQHWRGATMNTNTMYKDHMSQYIPYLTQYATNTVADANMHDYMTQMNMKQVDHLQHQHLQHDHFLDSKNSNMSNEQITKNAVTSNLKDGFLVCQQPPLNTITAYYGNEQMSSSEDSKFSNMYAYDSKKTETESAARQIYEILTHMQPGYRTSSSSESSTSSGNNTMSSNYNANYYVPNSIYYQPSNEISDFRQMAHCLQVGNLSNNMFGSSTYY